MPFRPASIILRPGPMTLLGIALALAISILALQVVGRRTLPTAAEQSALPTFTRQDVIPSPGVNFVRGADLDGDGRVDFVGLDTVYDRGTGNPIELQLTWWRQEAPAPGEPAGFDFDAQPSPRGAPRDLGLLLGVGDLDADGNQDLVTVDPNGQVSAWLNEDGGAGFPQRRSAGRVHSFDVVDGDADAYLEVANLDADLDRHADLLLVREGRDLTWYPSRGSVGQVDLGPAQTILRGTDARQLIAVTTGDLNDDGLVDLATATDKTGDKIAWWLQRMDGDERVFEKIGEGDEDDVRDLTMADLDGDGDLDILVTSQIGSQPYRVFAWLNTGAGTDFERDPTALSSSANNNHKWRSIDAADVNADGAIDFITSEFTENSNSGRLCWYENPGAPVPTAEPSAEPTGAATSTPADATATPTVSSTPGDDPSPTANPSEPSPSAEPVTATPTDGSPVDDWMVYLPRLVHR